MIGVLDCYIQGHVILGYGVLTSEKAITLNIQKGFLALVIIALCYVSKAYLAGILQC